MTAIRLNDGATFFLSPEIWEKVSLDFLKDHYDTFSCWCNEHEKTMDSGQRINSRHFRKKMEKIIAKKELGLS